MAEAAQEDVERGIDPRSKQEAKDKRNNEPNVTELCTLFIEKYAKPTNKSWRDTDSVLERFVKPHWGEQLITSITRQDVIDFMDMLEKNEAASTPRHTFKAIRRMFGWAAERNMIKESPCRYIKTPGKMNQRDRVLTDDEIKAVFASLDDLMAYPYGALVKFLLLTGQRLRECSDVTWAEVDMDNALWTIPPNQK